MTRLFLLPLIYMALLGASCFAQELNLEQPVLEAKAPETIPSASGPWSQITPSADLRFVYLYKEHPSSAGRQGLGLMQSILGLDFNPSPNLQIVTRYDLGFMRAGAREVYIESSDLLGFNSAKIGRFNLPFGHRLSDHRVYVKKFFAVSLNDFESGISVQKTWGPLGATFSLVQGLGSGEAFQNNEQLLTPAYDLKTDFETGSFEWTLGHSGFQTYRASGKGANQQQDRNFALTLYAKAKISTWNFWGESTWGWKRAYLVSDLGAFVGDTTFANTLKDQKALGFWFRLDKSFKKTYIPFYEYDQIVFDTRHHADRFQKHSLGTKFVLNEVSDLETRLEWSREGRSSQPDLRRKNNAFLVTLHVFF